MSSHFLTGKMAIVTGGSGTIGKAIAKALLQSGCHVLITGRNVERLEKAKQELEQEVLQKQQQQHQGAEAKIYTFDGDVTNEQSVISLFDHVKQLSPNNDGCCDLLVNNAGINIQGTTEELSAEDFTKVMQVNVVGPFICAREALKQMKQRAQRTNNSTTGGRIINVGSLAASRTRPHTAPYTTSKFALLGMTQSLAVDARQYNIAVGIIHPGNVLSDILTPEQVKERGETEGFISAEDVSACVMTMASMPYSANVLELTVLPTKQPFVGRG